MSSTLSMYFLPVDVIKGTDFVERFGNRGTYVGSGHGQRMRATSKSITVWVFGVGTRHQRAHVSLMHWRDA